LATARWPWRIKTGREAPTKTYIDGAEVIGEYSLLADKPDTEAKVTEKYPEYETDMRLLAETAPYLLSEAELDRYG